MYLLQDFTNGVYSIDKPSREQWEAFEDFPPYEIFVDKGEELFKKPFKNGKTYASCFPNAEKGMKQNYPYFDKSRKEVITIELAINECRKKNGEEAAEIQEQVKWHTCQLTSHTNHVEQR